MGKNRSRYIKRGSVLLYSLFFMAIIFFILGGYLLIENDCSRTVNFSVDNVDSRFKISKQDVIQATTEAGALWNSQSGENLLKYNPNSSLKIELIYDQRQADLDKLNSMSDDLGKNKEAVESTNQKYESLVTSFQKDLAKYNKTVDYWNGKGGAPQDVFNQLNQEKKDLDSRRKSLVDLANSLNIKASDYNSDLKDLQAEINKRKNIIITQGLYKPAENKIEIYTFGNKDELRLVLMHELGHSLGLSHGNQNNSIMYYLLGNQDLKNPTLTSEDIAMLNDRCKINNPNLYNSIFRLVGAIKSIK